MFKLLVILFIIRLLYIALLVFFMLLKKCSRYVLYCLKLQAGCLYCVLMTIFLLILLSLWEVTQTLINQTWFKRQRIVNEDAYTNHSAMLANLVY